MRVCAPVCKEATLEIYAIVDIFCSNRICASSVPVGDVGWHSLKSNSSVVKVFWKFKRNKTKRRSSSQQI